MSQFAPVKHVHASSTHDGNVLWWLSSQDFDDIVRRDPALLFEANHVSTDNAATEIGVGHTKHRRVRSRSDPGEHIDAVRNCRPSISLKNVR